MRRVRAGAAAGWALGCFLLIGPLAAQHDWSGGQIERARDLMRTLNEGGVVRIAFLGDSLTAGWTAWSDTEAYARVFCDAVALQFPAARVEPVLAGEPGCTSGQALSRMQNDVIQREPDLLVVQLGGNDKGKGRTGSDLYADLVAILQTARDKTKAPVIVCTPPIVTDANGEPFLHAVRSAAQAQRVALADFDAALLAWDHDYRGVYPWERHPGSDVHLVMAKELHNAFCTMLAVPQPLQVSIEPLCQAVAPGEQFGTRVRIANEGTEPFQGTATVAYGPAVTCTTVELPPGDETQLPIDLTAPMKLPGGRTARARLSATVAGGGVAAFDARWLAVAPLALVHSVPQASPVAPPAVPTGWRQAIGGDSVVLGYAGWGGPWDLSARFGLACSATELVVRVEVRDDEVRPNAFYAPTLADLVEVWFDGRPATTQGRASHSPAVFGVLLAPPDARKGSPTSWRTLDALPAGIGTTAASAAPMEGGFRVLAHIPLKALGCQTPDELELKGLEVALDDADSGPRESQAMWAGGPDAFVDASLFGAMTLRPERVGWYRATVR